MSLGRSASPTTCDALACACARIALMAILLMGCAPATEEGPPRAETPIDRPSADRITLEGVSIHTSGETSGSSLQATSLVYRNRKGAAGFATYHDLAEVFATDAQLSFELKAPVGFSSVPKTMDSLLASGIGPLSPKGESMEERGSHSTLADRDLKWPIVTRWVFERLTINRVSPIVGISLDATRGQHDVAKGMLLLEGRVILRTSRGEEIHSARAVLSREHDGLYFPLGYQRNGESTTQSAFVVLDEHGNLSATRGAGHLRYEDLIAERERIVLLHYAERAPRALRPLLVAILSGMRAN